MDDNQKEKEPYILFHLAGTDYGIPCRLVKQMEMVEEMTPVPNAPAYVEGLIFIRGQVVPAINLRARFGFDRIPYDLTTRLIVVRSGERNVGLIVDSAREFVTMPEEDLQPPPDSVSGLSGDYLKGIATIGERLILVLDVDEVLTRREKEELEKTVEKTA
jgi:purine-binding chemotaxis protein CheW